MVADKSDNEAAPAAKCRARSASDIEEGLIDWLKLVAAADPLPVEPADVAAVLAAYKQLSASGDLDGRVHPANRHSAIAGHFPSLPPTPPPIGPSYKIRYQVAAYLESGLAARHDVGVRRGPGERDMQALELKGNGRSYAEIAEALGVREHTVGPMLSRARRADRVPLAKRRVPCLPDEHAPPDVPGTD